MCFQTGWTGWIHNDMSHTHVCPIYRLNCCCMVHVTFFLAIIHCVIKGIHILANVLNSWLKRTFDLVKWRKMCQLHPAWPDISTSNYACCTFSSEPSCHHQYGSNMQVRWQSWTMATGQFGEEKNHVPLLLLWVEGSVIGQWYPQYLSFHQSISTGESDNALCSLRDFQTLRVK